MADKTYAVAPLKKTLLDGNEYEFRLSLAAQRRTLACFPKIASRTPEDDVCLTSRELYEACLDKRGQSPEEFMEILPPGDVVKDWRNELIELSKSPAVSPTTASVV